MKTTKIAIALASAMCLFGMPAMQAQENGKGHELSVSVQGLGIGSMPFRGVVSWEDQPGLSIGANIGYTYWFGEHFGFRTGVRMSRFSHNQKITNFEQPLTADLQLSSLGLPGGSTPTTVNLLAKATSIQEEQQYTYIELPIQLAMRFGGWFANVGLSLSKAVSATADYSFTDPALYITEIPAIGITPNPAVPMTLNSDTKGSVKNVDMTKPFYCLLDAEVGYNIPLGDASNLAVGLFGRYAPIAHKTNNNVDIYVLQPDATGAKYILNQPSTSAQVEKIGYYEVGVSLGVNFGLGRKHRSAQADEQAETLKPVDNRYEQAVSEIAALKAAREKNEAEIAALKAAQKKAESDMAAMKASQQKAENDLAAMQAAANRQQAAAAASQQAAPAQVAKATRENAQKKLDDLKATIYFEFKGTSVNPSAEEDEAIRAICEAMKANPEMQVIITGHADNKGSAKTNWRYGIKRAQALKRYMVKQGAPADNIKCDSKGERQPIDDNNTKEGRAKNRRATVELK